MSTVTFIQGGGESVTAHHLCDGIRAYTLVLTK